MWLVLQNPKLGLLQTGVYELQKRTILSYRIDLETERPRLVKIRGLEVYYVAFIEASAER